MAIDKNKTKILIDEINSLFEELTKNLPADSKDWLRENIIGKAIKEIDELVSKSRPPVMFLIGRSGHGKSSLINALAGKEVAKIGDTKPETKESEPYTITFPETYSTWQIIDSRGLFESTKPQGAKVESAKEQLKNDLKKHKPDIICHVISAPETRNLEQDLLLFDEITKSLSEEMGAIPPAIIVLNKTDTIGNPREWPPEKSAQKSALIKALLDYVSIDVFKLEPIFLDLNNPIIGYKIITDSSPYLAVVPICSLSNEHWNIDILSEYIGDNLPKSAQLDFFQAQQRKHLLQKFSTSMIKKFSNISAGIGAIPIPVADIFILTPLQMLLIAIIGGLSCRSMSMKTAKEFMAAVGVNVIVAGGLRAIARQLVKFVPGGGSGLSAGIAYSGTLAIGKSAEYYFFNNEIRQPTDFESDTEIKENI